MIEILDLNNAVSFRMEGKGQRNLLGAIIVVQGPKVYCQHECKDLGIFSVLETSSRISDDPWHEVLKRKTKAIEFLRKSCPGKPF
jgi:hypothetical protein